VYQRTVWAVLMPMNLIDRFRHHRARTAFIRAMLEAHDEPSRLDVEDVRAASVRLQAMVDGLPRIPEQVTRSGDTGVS
jgi:hypothetical protein